MKRRSRTKSAEIDVTPLIDVLFMLIIFFVLTASFVQGNIQVELPSAEGRPTDATAAVILTVAPQGKYFWDGREVAADQLPALAADLKGKKLLVAGDKNVPYGKVAEALSLLRKAGVPSAGLMLAGEDKK
mgnify:CR=1 FL=1